VRLARPELLVVSELLEQLAEVPDRVAPARRGRELLDRLGAQALELEAIALAALLGRGGQVDRHGRRVASRQQLLEVGAGRDIGVQGRPPYERRYARSLQHK
jgi:hypothetical protein